MQSFRGLLKTLNSPVVFIAEQPIGGQVKGEAGFRERESLQNEVT